MKKEIFDILYKYKRSKNRNDKDVAKLLGGSKYRSEVNRFMKEDWYSIVQEPKDTSSDLTPVLDKIHHLIRIHDFNQNNTWKHKVVKWYSYAAAILLIPVIVTSVSYILVNSLNSSSDPELSSVSIEAPNGRIVHFNLPDGTSGVLHGGSELAYQLPFTNNRNIHLKGQAFFDVTHDKDHPFVVKTKEMRVEVLGTRFEIKAFDNEDFNSVLLERGKVLCEIPSIAKKVILKPDQEVYVKDQDFKVYKANAHDLTRWKDGLLIFRDETMQEVAKELTRWYNVDITIEDEVLNNYTFRATFNNEPIEEVLNLLSRTSPIKYKIEKRKVNKNGLYYKKHIKIYKVK